MKLKVLLDIMENGTVIVIHNAKTLKNEYRGYVGNFIDLDENEFMDCEFEVEEKEKFLRMLWWEVWEISYSPLYNAVIISIYN